MFMSLHGVPVQIKHALACCPGAEIYLRHPSRYNLSTNSDHPMTFSEVSEVARQHQETALGYVLQDGTVISAPSADQQQVLQAGDQIIALAEQAWAPFLIDSWHSYICTNKVVLCQWALTTYMLPHCVLRHQPWSMMCMACMHCIDKFAPQQS